MPVRYDFRVLQLRGIASILVAHGFLLLALLIVPITFTGGKRAMAADNANSSSGGKFMLLWSGGHNWGSREISFDGKRRLYYAIGDTLNNESKTGVGAFELFLQNADLEAAKSVAHILCDKDIQEKDSTSTDSPAIFSATCFDGKATIQRTGLIHNIPDDLKSKLFSITSKLSDKAYFDGIKLVKLDFEPFKVERRDGSFVASVRFINSGNEWVKFSTPDQWKGTAWGGRLGIGAISRITNGMSDPIKNSWGFALGGKKLLNKDEFPEGVVTLNPGEAKILEFLTVPDNRAAKGEYEFSGIAFMDLVCERGGAALSGLVVLSPIKARITIDRDYPSTPEEREQWEATHRASMSSHPVKPGETFAEDGLYRAVTLIHGIRYRSLQLTPFKAGNIATTENVRMPMDHENGIDIDGPVQWEWEATAPTPVKQYSLDLIDDTRQFCAPGSTCPRSGRWVARIAGGADFLRPEYHHDLSSLVALRRGRPMPAIRDQGKPADWEWLGA